MPTPVPLPPPETALVRAINHQRVVHGLKALRPTRGLTRLAENHSKDQMRHQVLGHASSNGASFNRRLAALGSFKLSGEVVSWTSGGRRATAATVVRAWMRSSSHRAEILNPRFRTLGVGRARNGRGTWVTADLVAR